MRDTYQPEEIASCAYSLIGKAYNAGNREGIDLAQKVLCGILEAQQLLSAFRSAERGESGTERGRIGLEARPLPQKHTAVVAGKLNLTRGELNVRLARLGLRIGDFSDSPTLGELLCKSTKLSDKIIAVRTAMAQLASGQ